MVHSRHNLSTSGARTAQIFTSAAHLKPKTTSDLLTMVPTVLVTGATGYTGSHCIRILLRQGYKVKGTVRSLKNPAKVEFLQKLYPPAANSLQLVEADLSNEAPWAGIVKGCDYVLHVASPVPTDPNAGEDEIVKPAIEGALMVLRACRDSGSVKRVVMTSSNTAIYGNFVYRKEPYTEADWANFDGVKGAMGFYVKSKTLAEKAAWDFIKSLPAEKRFELAVINPTFIAGPSVSPQMCGSLYFLKAMLDGEKPMKHGLGVNDVRDVAQAHVSAMHAPASSGKRHILVSEHLWCKDMARILKEEFEPQGYKITLEESTDENAMLPVQEKIPIFDGSFAKRVLGINMRLAKVSLLDMAYGLIEAGHVEKKPGYKGPKCSENQ